MEVDELMFGKLAKKSGSRRKFGKFYKKVVTAGTRIIENG